MLTNTYLWLALACGIPACFCLAMSKRGASAMKSSTKKKSAHHQLQDQLEKMGFSRSPVKNGVLFGLIVLFSLGCTMMLGKLALPISFCLSTLLVFTVAQIHRNNVRLRLVQQLPAFVDQLNRRIKVGISLHQAVEQSARATTNPLKDVLQRVSHRQAIGVELQRAFEKESQITGVEAFYLLGSIFSINAHYGGSITHSLDSLVKLLRQQDLSRRELKSITGETRITAWVIGSAPLVVSAYMLTQNPELLLNMWYSESGREALILSILMQLTGVIVIWRMFRSL